MTDLNEDQTENEPESNRDNLPDSPEKYDGIANKTGKEIIQELFKGAIRNDGGIDTRSAYGRGMKAINSELQEDPLSATRDILCKDISIYSMLTAAIERFFVAHPDQIINENGQLNPLIKSDLIAISQIKTRLMGDLRKLSGSGGRGKNKRRQERDLSNIEF